MPTAPARAVADVGQSGLVSLALNVPGVIRRESRRSGRSADRPESDRPGRSGCRSSGRQLETRIVVGVQT
ncbi:hypothetical protein KR100_06010 [Synechococcus sp. KORDI-100]|nr:hypothetical protein KR100_06010 [Synechococcus sp. KORDI-100]